jgi:hypothetical protein
MQGRAHRKLLELVAAPAPQLAVGGEGDGVFEAARDGHEIDFVGWGLGEGVVTARGGGSKRQGAGAGDGGGVGGGWERYSKRASSPLVME